MNGLDYQEIAAGACGAGVRTVKVYGDIGTLVKGRVGILDTFEVGKSDKFWVPGGGVACTIGKKK